MRNLTSFALIFFTLMLVRCAQSPETVEQSAAKEQDQKVKSNQKKKGKKKKKPKKNNKKDAQESSAQVAETQVPDTYPLFPGCSETDYEARRACAQNKMIENLQKVIKYPAKARDDKVNGTVVHSFIIEANGTMSNLKLVKSLTPECDAAAYHAINDLMAASGPWEPGTMGGKAVAVQYQLPIQFKN